MVHSTAVDPCKLHKSYQQVVDSSDGDVGEEACQDTQVCDILDTEKVEITSKRKRFVTKKQKRMRPKKLVLNVAQTQYNIVRYVGKAMFKMRLNSSAYAAHYGIGNNFVTQTT